MERLQRFFFSGLGIDNFVFRAALLLTRWLEKNSFRKYDLLRKEALRKVDFSGPQGGTEVAAPLVTLQPERFKQERLESLAQQGLPVDTPSQTFDSWRNEQKKFSLPGWAEEIQPFLANQLSHHTRKAYEADLRQFFIFLEGKIPVENLASLRPEHVILFRKYLEEGRLHGGRPLEKATINRKLAVVKSFLNWLCANEVLDKNPARLVKGFPQSQESDLKGLSDEEAAKILRMPDRNKASGALHLAVLHVLLYLGLRKGELIGLKIGDMDEERGTPVLRVRGKGHKVRVLPLTAKVREAIEHYLHACRRDRSAKEEPLFIPTKNPRTKTLLKTLNPHAITYLVVRYARKAGVLKTISPHSCRATCISNALDKKATHRAVQSLAGWSTPLMIQRYDKRREDLKNSAAYIVDYADEHAAANPPETAAR